MALGFGRAGFEIPLAVDKDHIHAKAFAYNFPGTVFLSRDLAVTSGAELLGAAGVSPGEVDVVIGGPPCQGFSVGGRRAVDDPRNDLVHRFAVLVSEIKPRYFVFENVPGLLSIGWPILTDLIRVVRRCGYDVLDPLQVLDASAFHVPQRRRRLFVLGYRSGLTPPRYPIGHDTPTVTVRDAIGDLELAAGDKDVYLGTLPTPSAWVTRLNRDYSSGGSPEGIDGCRHSVHRPDVVGRFASVPQGQREATSRLWRLDPSGVAPTLRSGAGPDKGSYTAPRPIHYQAPRCITVREAARLQGFPDSFRFHGTTWHAHRQIGSSVPPPLAYAVAREVRAALERDREDGSA